MELNIVVIHLPCVLCHETFVLDIVFQVSLFSSLSIIFLQFFLLIFHTYYPDTFLLLLWLLNVHSNHQIYFDTALFLHTILSPLSLWLIVFSFVFFNFLWFAEYCVCFLLSSIRCKISLVIHVLIWLLPPLFWNSGFPFLFWVRGFQLYSC